MSLTNHQDSPYMSLKVVESNKGSYFLYLRSVNDGEKDEKKYEPPHRTIRRKGESKSTPGAKRNKQPTSSPALIPSRNCSLASKEPSDWLPCPLTPSFDGYFFSPLSLFFFSECKILSNQKKKIPGLIQATGRDTWSDSVVRKTIFVRHVEMEYDITQTHEAALLPPVEEEKRPTRKF